MLVHCGQWTELCTPNFHLNLPNTFQKLCHRWHTDSIHKARSFVRCSYPFLLLVDLQARFDEFYKVFSRNFHFFAGYPMVSAHVIGVYSSNGLLQLAVNDDITRLEDGCKTHIYIFDNNFDPIRVRIVLLLNRQQQRVCMRTGLVIYNAHFLTRFQLSKFESYLVQENFHGFFGLPMFFREQNQAVIILSPFLHQRFSKSTTEN